MEDQKKKAMELLREKHRQLGRLPKKSDFENNQIVLIKAVLGPWPRALEKAGLKPVPPKKQP